MTALPTEPQPLPQVFFPCLFVFLSLSLFVCSYFCTRVFASIVLWIILFVLIFVCFCSSAFSCYHQTIFFRANPFCLLYFCLDNHLHRKKLKLSSLEIKAKTLTKRRFHPIFQTHLLSNSIFVSTFFIDSFLYSSLFYEPTTSLYVTPFNLFAIKKVYLLFLSLSLSLSLTRNTFLGTSSQCPVLHLALTG